MSTAIDLIKLKIESPWEVLIHRINKFIYGKKKANEIKYFKMPLILKKKYLRDGIWNFNGVKLPDFLEDPSGHLIYYIYMDTLFTYCRHSDNYNYKLVDKLDKYLPEGTYGYEKDNFDVRVFPNDVVIDAGAWIGDFSAYASIKGAKVYAFEPSKNTMKYLMKTQKMNQNIEIIESGLGSKRDCMYLTNEGGNSGSNKITLNAKDSEKIQITTIDDFVNEYNIDRVDFIKSDIEGFEREMLKGAKNTLKRFAPKLAICTYHLPDDPDVLSKLILEANPNYTIVQKRKKLYAMVIPQL